MNNTEQFKRIIKWLSSCVIICAEMAVYWIVWIAYYNQNIELPFFRKGNWLMAAMFGVLLYFFSKIYGGLKIGYLKFGDVIYSQILALFCTTVITYFQICLLDRHFVNAVPLLAMMAAQVVIIILWTFAFQKIYASLFPPRRMLLIYGDRPAFGLKEKIDSRSDKYIICEAIHIDSGWDSIYKAIHRHEAVIIGDISSEARNEILKYCFSNSIRIYMLPKISDIIVRGSEDIHLFDSPLLLSRNGGFTIEQKIIKRTTDIVISMIALILCSPVMLITAIAIKLYDGGSIIHKQIRLTMGGREFYVYKFRSMIEQAEKEGFARLAEKDDPRITPVGKIIRRTRIDELPQFINVLRGEMSLVGPRPERPMIAAEYSSYMPEFHYRLKVKGGLTGYAQIYGKYNTTPYDKLKLDLMYIENYSFWLDIKLILMTIKIIFMKESTEGIAEGQITATADPNIYLKHLEYQYEEDKGSAGK